jgi:hypothetical protein
MSDMRAKLRVNFVEKHSNGETLHFNAVGKPNGYPEGGLDEDNTYAKYTPQADLKITINNPTLFGAFEMGDICYVDFTKV